MRSPQSHGGTTKCPADLPASRCNRRSGFFAARSSGEPEAWRRPVVSEIARVPIPPRPEDLDVRRARLEAALASRVLVLDGATGTALQAANLTAADFGGPELEGCNENLCATRPDVVDVVHESYLKAGCDIVETNSFGGTPLVLAEYGLAHRAYELNAASARIARTACARHDTPETTHF